MEVKKGYKQTEIGMIPEEWNVTPLGTMATFRTGPFGSTLHKSDYVAGGVPVINPMQIVDGRLIPTNSMAVTEEAAQKLSEFRLTPGNVVIGRRGEMGRCAFVGKEHLGWICGTGSMILRPLDVLDARYLQRVLSSPPMVAAIENTSVGTTMINLNHGTLRNLLIATPPLPEQEAIAEALSDADGLIESLEQLVAKKRQIKHGAMQELLTGHKRLPGFSGEWIDRPLGRMAEIRSGGTPSTTQRHYWDGNIPWCTPTDITALNGSKYLHQTSRSISVEGLKASSAEMLPVRSVVMTSRATIGECAISTVPVCTNQGFKNFIPHEDVDAEFLYYILTTKKEDFTSLCGGSTFLEIGKTQLLPFVLRTPAVLAEQTAIATVLADMDTEIAAIEAKLSKARLIKQGMMQELLTGRIRLV
ncbi:MAG: restriction endonuclease subunit S [Phycisphaeraceae bacterium]